MITGVVLNAWSVAQLLAVDVHVAPLVRDDTGAVVPLHGVVALQVVLVVCGGWVLWRQPPLRRTAVAGCAVALLVLMAALGGYGTARAVWSFSATEQRLARIDRSEQVYLALSRTLETLNRGLLDLDFPHPRSALSLARP